MSHTAPTHSPMISIGPRVRKSPYFDATLRWGAKAFTVYNHMYMATHYGDPVAEYWSLVRDVTLWDVSCQRQIVISGPDAQPFVELLTPRDLSNCPSHRCLYVILTDQNGGIVNDAVLMHMRENEFWLSPGDGDVILWAQGIAIQSGMDVQVSEGDICPLQLQGPKSPHVAYKLFGQAALELGYYHVIETELNGLRLAISRTGWSGELGYELYLEDHIHGDELWETVMAAGEEFNIVPAAPNTIRSIEGGLLSYFSDMRRVDNPYTFGLDRLVDLDKKAEFIGREALRKIKNEGDIRRLVGIEIEGEPISHNESFWPVLENGERTGHVSRCVWSPRLERNIGWANVPAASTATGTPLTVACPDGDRFAVVVEAPWFPAEKIIPEGIGQG
ncbi:glycine cleavage T C-terminal barrel domain-containing protein [Pseudomonadota bacterium]